MLESFERKLGEITVLRFLMLMLALQLLFASAAYLVGSMTSSSSS
jgi:hypothetical protein